MKVTLAYRRYGRHDFRNEAEVSGTFDDYCKHIEGQDYEIDERKLIKALPRGFLVGEPGQILLCVEEDWGGTGQINLNHFRSWAKYFDSYVLNIHKDRQ